VTAGWMDLPPDTPFGVDNLPFGVFSTEEESPRVGVAIGSQVLDLAPLAAAEGLDGAHVFESPTLNDFLSLGRPSWRAVRSWLTELLTHRGYADVVEAHLVDRSDVRLHLPVDVADYVDFYASEHHATNVGQIFRPDAPSLPASWRHLPIGYHGRAGTVVVSGTDVVRPRGQRREPGAPAPSYGASTRLDIEAEVAYIVGVPTELGRQVTVDEFEEHVFGLCLLNDWSARDIQSWESQPLGPFLGKSFATSLSPWVAATGPRRPPRPEPRAAAVPAGVGPRPGLRLRPAARGPDQRQPGVLAAVRLDVLVAGTDAGPSDGQRGQPPDGRRLRLGHGLRARTSPTRFAAGAVSPATR
jgi:fumarylacetoacetase